MLFSRMPNLVSMPASSWFYIHFWSCTSSFTQTFSPSTIYFCMFNISRLLKTDYTIMEFNILKSFWYKKSVPNFFIAMFIYGIVLNNLYCFFLSRVLPLSSLGIILHESGVAFSFFFLSFSLQSFEYLIFE